VVAPITTPTGTTAATSKPADITVRLIIENFNIAKIANMLAIDNYNSNSNNNMNSNNNSAA